MIAGSIKVANNENPLVLMDLLVCLFLEAYQQEAYQQIHEHKRILVCPTIASLMVAVFICGIFSIGSSKFFHRLGITCDRMVIGPTEASTFHLSHPERFRDRIPLSESLRVAESWDGQNPATLVRNVKKWQMRVDSIRV